MNIYIAVRLFQGYPKLFGVSPKLFGGWTWGISENSALVNVFWTHANKELNN